jgi:hypothetical protein
VTVNDRILPELLSVSFDGHACRGGHRDLAGKHLQQYHIASFAFSPTDTLPLTRRAKMLRLLQSAISIITLTAIANSAINILAGSN